MDDIDKVIYDLKADKEPEEPVHELAFTSPMPGCGMVNHNGQHIFIVDDELKVRQVVGETLEQLSARVTCFPCASDCLEQLSSQKCELLITDLRMPDMDGIELLRRARVVAPWYRC